MSSPNPTPPLAPDHARALREQLLAWYDHHKRELPWRQVSDPYAIWVSEIMLQQTRVATVIDYWTRWMERYPGVEALAAAELDEVLELWAGLGYYRRARFLHRAARQLVEERDGELPADVDGLKKLPGVGPYTAGAIASIAFGQPAALVDGNVERVLARLCAIPGDPKDTANQKRFWTIARQLVVGERPGEFNQSLMELGATVCIPQSPRCLLCPVRAHCQALALGDPADFPGKTERAAPRPVAVATLAVVAHEPADDGPHFLVARRPPTGLLAGLLELPTTAPIPDEQVSELEGGWRPHLRELADELALGLAPDQLAQARPIGCVEHVFSHLRMSFHVYLLELDRPTSPGPAERERAWLDAHAMPDAALPTAQRKVEARVREHLDGHGAPA